MEYEIAEIAQWVLFKMNENNPDMGPTPLWCAAEKIKDDYIAKHGSGNNFSEEFKQAYKLITGQDY